MKRKIKEKLRVALVGGITAAVGGLAYLHFNSGKEGLEWIAENERTLLVRPVINETPNNEGFRFRTEDGSMIKTKPDYRLEDHAGYRAFSESLRSRIEMSNNGELEISGYDGRVSGCVDNSGYFILTRVNDRKHKFSVWDLQK